MNDGRTASVLTHNRLQSCFNDLDRANQTLDDGTGHKNYSNYLATVLAIELNEKERILHIFHHEKAVSLFHLL